MKTAVTGMAATAGTSSGSTAEANRPLHIRLAAPCFACRIPASFFLCVKQARDACQAAGVVLSVDLIGNESLVQRARNVLAERFLRSNADKLFFVDSDITFSAEDFLRIARNPKDVVAGAYAKKDIRWDDVERGVLEGKAEPVHSLGLNYNVNVLPDTKTCDDGTFPVLDAATGFMCLSRRVLTKLCDAFREPLLVNNDLPHMGDSADRIEQYVAIMDCMIDPDSRRYLSEDYALCRRLQQIGEKVWLDFRTTLSHDGSAEFRGDARQVWETVKNARARLAGPPPQVASRKLPGKPPLSPGGPVKAGVNPQAAGPVAGPATGAAAGQPVAAAATVVEEVEEILSAR